MTKRLFALLCAAVLVLTMCSCGGTPQQSSAPPTQPGASSAQPGTPSATVQPSAPPTPDVSGPSKTVTVAYGFRPRSLDPNNWNDNTDQVHFQMFYESLIYSDHTGGGYAPMLATSWEVSPDASSWTFKLREGVSFSTGAPFDADDVVCTFEHLISLKDTSANVLSYMPTIDSVEKIDQYTVKISFDGPFALAGNAFRCMYIFSDEAFEEFGPEVAFDKDHSYGTGPWILNEYIDGQYAHYVKNENYWNKDKFDSYYEEVYSLHLSEPSSIVAGHLSGDINAYCRIGGFDMDLLPLYASAQDRISIVSMNTNSNDFVTCQLGEQSQVSDINLRKAISYAIDRQRLYDTLSQGLGQGATFFWAPNMPGFDPDCEAYAYDPELAKEYLAASSYDGSPLRFMTEPSGINMNFALAIADMLAKVGIDTLVQGEDSMTWNTRRAASDYDLIMSGTRVPDKMPGRHLGTLLSDNSKTNNTDEVLFELIRNFNVELDPAKREQLLSDIGNRCAEVYAPHIVVGHPGCNHAVDKGITGISLYEDGMVNFAYIDYDGSAEPVYAFTGFKN